jgi:ABC-2 type transport system permease protein
VSEPANSSNIYDLGYRHYDGQRIGRRGTLLTLYVHALRSAFGLGRRTAAKIVPIGLTVLAYLPAVVQLGIGAITNIGDENVELFKHEDYFDYVRVVLVLFCAAVAPELVGRDQRTRVLSLYFSRAVTRFDYVLAKLAALTTAMLFLTLGPQALLFLGNGMAGDDVSGYLSDKWDLVLPILVGSLLVSLAIASVGLAIAAYLPRRAYATAAIVGAFILTLAAANILRETVEPDVARWAQLVSPMAWEGMIGLLFGVEPVTGDNPDPAAVFSGWVYLLAVLVTIALGVGLTLRRMRKVST